VAVTIGWYQPWDQPYLMALSKPEVAPGTGIETLVGHKVSDGAPVAITLRREYL
jgi:hypothetical protein